MATVALRLSSGDELGAGLRICDLGIGRHTYTPTFFLLFF